MLRRCLGRLGKVPSAVLQGFETVKSGTVPHFMTCEAKQRSPTGTQHARSSSGDDARLHELRL